MVKAIYFAPASGVAALHPIIWEISSFFRIKPQKPLTISISLDKIIDFQIDKPLWHNHCLSRKQNVDMRCEIFFMAPKVQKASC